MVRLLESWSLVIHYPVCSYAADPWFVRHSSICSDQGRSSIGSSIAALSLLRCSSVAGPLLIHHWSIVDPSLVHHWSITGPSLVHHWSITALSARPLLSCHSSVCSSVAGPSTGVVVTGPSLVCLLLHRSSACTSPLVCRWSVADPWLIWLLESWSLVRGSYITRPSTRVVAVLSLGSTRHCFTSVRLFDSTLRSS